MDRDNKRSKKNIRHPNVFDYKDHKTLQRYIDQYGRIESRRRTNLSEKQQKQLASAVKKSRHMALLPFVG